MTILAMQNRACVDRLLYAANTFGLQIAGFACLYSVDRGLHVEEKARIGLLPTIDTALEPQDCYTLMHDRFFEGCQKAGRILENAAGKTQKAIHHRAR
jgi:hypothetical protein